MPYAVIMHPTILAVASSPAGITTAVVSIFTALTLLVTALTGLSVARATARKAAEALATTSAKLDVIHTLTNATLTAAKQSELDATRRELIMMREMMSYRSEAGHEPSTEMVETVASLATRVDQLINEMSDRARQAVAVAAQEQR